MDRRSFLAAAGSLPLSAAGAAARQESRAGASSRRVEILRSIRGVPPDIVGEFRSPVAFQQDGSGQYFVFRTFGTLRPTGQEQDSDLHQALNAGLPLVGPRGGFYFVFQTGVPMFRRYDPAGNLLFERHVEGREIDPVINALPTEWPRRRAGDREIPLVRPVVRAARMDGAGRLWITFATVPFTYVYDEDGEKARVVQFRAAGIMSPNSLFFSRTARLLVTPGCFEFDAAGPRS